MKTKEILKEWKHFLKKDMLNEISIKIFQEQHPDFDVSEFSSQLRGNTDYLDIISNSINAGQNHGPDDYKQQFEYYKSSIEPNRNNQDFLSVDIPGEDVPVTLKGKLIQGSCTATYDDIQQFQQARMFALGKGNRDRLTEAYLKVISEASETDFELIAEDSNWIIFYPKSIRGSIALARSYWNKNKIDYDTTFQPSKGFGENTGNMRWCTSVSGSGNLFLMYHRQLNAHMYYCIKKDLKSIKDVDRKLCISLVKSRNVVSYRDDHLSVNANNYKLDEKTAKKYLGSLFDDLLNDVKKEARLEKDAESYFRSVGLEQYITIRNANEENISDFVPELSYILLHSKDADKILNYSINDSSSEIRQLIAQSDRLNRQQIEDLANDIDENVRANIAIRSDLQKSLFLKFVSDPSPKVKLNVCKSKHVTSEILEELSSDSSEDVAREISYSPEASEDALLNIISRHTTNPKVIEVAINNSNLSNETFRKLFDNETFSPSIKSFLVPRGFRDKIINTQEIIDIYNEIKNLGQMSFDKAKYFYAAEIEEIFFDIADFCEKNIKGNKKEVDQAITLMLMYGKGASERVITKIYNMTKDKDVMKKIASHPNTPASILNELLLSSQDTKSGRSIRSSIANNYGVTIDILEKLSYDEASSVRYNVAYNPNVNVDILERLSKDTSKKVSKIALMKLEEKIKSESHLKNYIKLVLS